MALIETPLIQLSSQNKVPCQFPTIVLVEALKKSAASMDYFSGSAAHALSASLRCNQSHLA
jgi:hypothetical protein